MLTLCRLFLNVQMSLASVAVVEVEVLPAVVVGTWAVEVSLSEGEATVVDIEEALVGVDIPHISIFDLGALSAEWQRHGIHWEGFISKMVEAYLGKMVGSCVGFLLQNGGYPIQVPGNGPIDDDLPRPGRLMVNGARA